MSRRETTIKAAVARRCTCIDDERTCEEHNINRTELERLRAEVRDLKSRLKAARLAMDVDEPRDHGAGFCGHPKTCDICVGYRATDLRVKNWGKP